MQDTARQPNLRPWQHAALFLLACFILISRRPDAIFHAQFWAEDGSAWFADAYNLGWWEALLRAKDGYFQTFPRLCASVALLVPLSLAPLVPNLCAIAVQALPAGLMLSSRSLAWGSLRFRAVLAATYLALPNSTELSGTITNSQWILTLCVFILLVATTPKSIAARLFDLSVLILCGLTGPFCIFLLPIALLLAWLRRDRWRWVISGILAALCLIQACGLLIVNPSGRPHDAALGASPASFAHIIAGQVYLGTLLGENRLALRPTHLLSVLLILVAVGGTAIIAICFVKSGLEMKLFILLSSLLLAASLITPVTYPPAGFSTWDVLAGSCGVRYWFFPDLAFAWSLAWCFSNQNAYLKILGGFLSIVMCFAMIRDWRHAAFTDLRFAEDAKRFEAAPAGTVVTIPENPKGWTIRLVKHN
jgi:hypothetical protein